MIRSSSRGRTDERGFALLAAIVLAVLYFGLMELLLIDSSRELREAQRFRSRIIALALAENAAELAAVDMTNLGNVTLNPKAENGEGTMEGRLVKSGSSFWLHGEAASKGVVASEAWVDLRGDIDPDKEIHIRLSQHSQ